MGTTQVEKTEQELRKEIEELHRQQWEVCIKILGEFVNFFMYAHHMFDRLLRVKITERLRDPRGIRRGGMTASGPRNFAAGGPARQRGFVRPVIISSIPHSINRLLLVCLSINCLFRIGG